MVRSTKDLKREINELADKEDARLTDKTLPENERAKIRSRVHAYNQSLSKINSFEAGWRKRLKLVNESGEPSLRKIGIKDIGEAYGYIKALRDLLDEE